MFFSINNGPTIAFFTEIRNLHAYKSAIINFSFANEKS